MTNSLGERVNKQIALDIYNQLGGNKFAVMTGARNLFSRSDTAYGGMQIDFKGSQKANRLVVLVDAMDTYTVEFWKIGRETCKKVEAFDDIYCDMLQSIFTQVTGLYCTLGTMGR